MGCADMAKDQLAIGFGVLDGEQLRRFVTATGENVTIDAKRACSWDEDAMKAKLAKDIVAFANSERGGVIVIGKEEMGGTLQFKGLDEAQLKSFDTTKVSKWINSRFHPAISLTCYTYRHVNDDLVVIAVDEFSDIPHLCTKQFGDGGDKVTTGTLVVRTEAAESTRLQTTDQFRTLIQRAVFKQQDKIRQMLNDALAGQLAPKLPTDEAQFELSAKAIEDGWYADDPETALAGKWKLTIHPASFERRWDEAADLRQILDDCNVQTVRFPRQYPEPQATDWGAQDAYQGRWGLSYEGLFLYRTTYFEDAMPCKSQSVSENVIAESGEWISYAESLWTIRKFYLFAHGFAQQFDAAENIRIVVEATNLKGRRLLWHDSMFNTISLQGPPLDQPSFRHAKTLPAGQLTADWDDLSVSCMKDFVSRSAISRHFDLSKATLLGAFGARARIGLG